jgi:hypothetical protein
MKSVVGSRTHQASVSDSKEKKGAAMADAMRAMLDELMGTERDVPLDQRTGRNRQFSVRRRVAPPTVRCLGGIEKEGREFLLLDTSMTD